MMVSEEPAMDRRPAPPSAVAWIAAVLLGLLLALPGPSGATTNDAAGAGTPWGGAGRTELRGTVSRVVDGDTLWFRPADPARPAVAVRLRGIDAPESCQRGGPQAGAALRAEVQGRVVILRIHGTDAYRRTLGTLRREGVDINRRMVETGHAWAWRDAKGRGPYTQAERTARRERLGLFADPAAQRPWEFRRAHGRCR